jgi:hypothetical protein
MSDLNQTYQNNDEQLIKYLEGKLAGEELYAFEKEMLDSSMLNDAVEGLDTIKNKHKIDGYVTDLNKHLHNYTSSKKKRRIKKRLQLDDWTLLSILLIIVLSVVAFIVIKKIK